jgi:pimeloyl-ACP methyl ester carboxylesterase
MAAPNHPAFGSAELNAAAYRLSSGRELTVTEFGPADGFPVLYLHGTPSTGNEWSVLGDDDLLEAFGLRLIAPTRPGLGGSSYLPQRTLASWKDDLADLVTQRGLTRFAVLGYSGGAAYAVASALAFEQHISSLTLVAPVLHGNEVMTAGLDKTSLGLKRLVSNSPWVGRLVLALAMGIPARRFPGVLKQQLLAVLPPVDAAALQGNGRIEKFVAVLADSFRAGACGPAQDMALMASPWDIALRRLSCPVHVFQGEKGYLRRASGNGRIRRAATRHQ